MLCQNVYIKKIGTKIRLALNKISTVIKSAGGESYAYVGPLTIVLVVPYLDFQFQFLVLTPFVSLIQLRPGKLRVYRANIQTAPFSVRIFRIIPNACKTGLALGSNRSSPIPYSLLLILLRFRLKVLGSGLVIKTNFDIDFDSNIINLNNFDFDFDFDSNINKLKNFDFD
jgi:hypothetical protein